MSRDIFRDEDQKVWKGAGCPVNKVPGGFCCHQSLRTSIILLKKVIFDKIMVVPMVVPIL